MQAAINRHKQRAADPRPRPRTRPVASGAKIAADLAKIKARLAESPRAQAPAQRRPAAHRGSLMQQLLSGNPLAAGMFGRVIGHAGFVSGGAR